MTLPPRHITISINLPFEDVYAFAANPENMPKWAAGLSGTIQKEGDHWISQSPMGKVSVYFAPSNNFGVIDHDVILENGMKFHNPLRVLPNAKGSEVVFTLFRQPEMTDADFERDAGMITKDLQTLKNLLES